MECSLGKIIEDLPYVANDKYSQYMIDRCNEHRNSYKKEVAYAKSIYSDMSVRVTDKTGYNKKDNTYYGYTKARQLIVRADIKHNRRFTMIPEYSIISAFYLPAFYSGWIRLFTSVDLISEYNGQQIQETDLEEVLRQSQSVPSWNDREFLEHILWLSRQGLTGVIHRQAEEIEIDGLSYVRVLLVHPFLPIGMRGCTDTYWLESEYDVTIYLEVINVSMEQWRSTIIDTLWIPNNPEGFHLIHKDLMHGSSKDPPESELLDKLYVDTSVVFSGDLPNVIVPTPSILTEDPNMQLYYDDYY